MKRRLKILLFIERINKEVEPLFLKKINGLFLCIGSLLVLFILKLPLNLSVVCANENQGFAFVFGQGLLLWNELACGRGILYVLLYSTILKIFGFNTWAIIAIHIVETIALLLIGLLIYLIVNKVLKNNLFAGVSVMLWVILISSPIGNSGLDIEILSHYYLSEEVLIVLFSLFSIWFLLLSNFLGYKHDCTFKEKMFSFFAGIFAACALMPKANGSSLLISSIIWIVLLFLFRKNSFKLDGTKILLYLFGVVISLCVLDLILYKLQGDLLLSWRDYFFVGSYNRNYLMSPVEFLKSLVNFMTRYTSSLNNLILFIITYLFFIFGFVMNLCMKNDKSKFSEFWLLISVLSIVDLCIIIAPGVYQPYYYQLIWPLVAIILSFGLKYLLETNKNYGLLLFALLTILFSHKIILSIPSHWNLMKQLGELSIFNQPQSFQDPVLSYDRLSLKRSGFLQLADAINNLLPDQKSTFYIFIC